MNISKAIMFVANALDCDVSELDDNASIYSNHKWDSLGHLAVMIKLEEEYNIEINQDSIEQFSSISSIANLLD